MIITILCVSFLDLAQRYADADAVCADRADKLVVSAYFPFQSTLSKD